MSTAAAALLLPQAPAMLSSARPSPTADQLVVVKHYVTHYANSTDAPAAGITPLRGNGRAKAAFAGLK